MKVLVLADTHLERGEPLPAAVLAAAAGADLILHAGDLVSDEVLDRLATFAPVEAVRGNMDPDALGARLPLQKLLTLGGVRVGLAHGDGAPTGLGDRVAARFPRADVVIHGHSHQPLITRYGKQLIINPGSPTDNRFAPYHSFAWLRLDGKSADAELVRLTEASR